MKLRIRQLGLLILAAIITLIMILILDSSAVIGAVSGVFLAAASAYTALDLKAVVKSTGELPAGQYAVADVGKYIAAMVLMSVLFIVAVIRQKMTGINLELAIGLLGPGIVAIIAIIIGGIKSNKIATGVASSTVIRSASQIRTGE